MLKDSIIQYVKENTAKISLEELDTVLTAQAIAGYFGDSEGDYEPGFLD